MVGAAKQDARVTCCASEKLQDQGFPVGALLDGVGCGGRPSGNSDRRSGIRGSVQEHVKTPKGRTLSADRFGWILGQCTEE